MRRTALHRLLVVVAVPLVASAAVPAAAANAAPAATKAPNVNIKGSPARYKPRTLTVKVRSGSCSTTNYAFSITNTTKKSQQVEVSGQDAGPPLASGSTQYECIGAGTVTFTLASNPKASLTVTGKK